MIFFHRKEEGQCLKTGFNLCTYGIVLRIPLWCTKIEFYEDFESKHWYSGRRKYIAYLTLCFRKKEKISFNFEIGRIDSPIRTLVKVWI